MIETKGLIAPTEVNRKKQDSSLRIDPQVEIRLERFNGEVINNIEAKAVINKREVHWDDKLIMDMGLVSHSGILGENDVKVEKNKRANTIKKQIKNQIDEEDKIFIRFGVVNAYDGMEIGEAKLELDELIDPNLKDLAKEYCVALNRSHLLEELLQQKQSKADTKEQKEAIKREIEAFTNYSGIIRF